MSDEEGGGHGDEELWLVSYADMMTLLFGFFVLMYTFAMAKLEKMPAEIDDDLIHLRREIAKYFGGDYVTPLEEAQEAFKKAVGGIDNDAMTAKLTPEGLDITFQSSAIFPSGSAEVNLATAQALQVLAQVVLSEKEEYRLIVEGHTDDVPIRSVKHRYPTNWELSSARASSVVRIFEQAGFESASLMAIGYGASRPKFPNRDELGNPIPENQARNRRIRIKLSLKGDGFDPSRDPDTTLPPQAVPDPKP